MQARLRTLARRLSLGRVLRYGALWARYYWRRIESAAPSHARGEDGSGNGDGVDSILGAAPEDAKRLAVASWFPLDLTNTSLHLAILSSIADARAELGLRPAVLACLARMKAAPDLTHCVDKLSADGETPETINTALYLLLLRRLPAPSEQGMVASRAPRHALISIRSGDEYRRQGLRRSLSLGGAG